MIYQKIPHQNNSEGMGTNDESTIENESKYLILFILLGKLERVKFYQIFEICAMVIFAYCVFQQLSKQR